MNFYLSTSQIYLATCIMMIQICVFASQTRGNEVKQSKDHRCEKILRKEQLINLHEKGPCEVSYKERCGWFSLDMCTFYRKEICEKNSNVTRYKYSKVNVCCDGFIEAPNGTCISKKSADPQWIIDKETNNTEVVYVNVDDIPTTPPTNPRKNHQIVHSDSEESTISHGAMAGAGCAALFLLTVVVFTVMGIYKRRKRKPKKTTKTEKDDAGMIMLTTST